MHILLIHQAYLGCHEAGGTRHSELARYLIQRGHQVTVVARSVDYVTGDVIEPPRIWGTREQEAGGMNVIRVWMYADKDRGIVHRLASYLSFSISSFLAGLRVRDVDVVWGTSPPLFQSLSALAISFLKRVPLVFEVRDLWPEFLIDMGVLKNSFVIWAARAVERLLYRRAARIVVNSPGFISYLKKHEVDEDRIDLVPNGVDMTLFEADSRRYETRESLGLEDEFVVLYAGALGLANDLGTILKAAKLLEAQTDIVFILLGKGKLQRKLQNDVRELALVNVRLLEAQPKSRIANYLSAADVCVATLMPIPTFKTTMPNKVFDYMAAGRPTVLAIDGVIRKIVEEAEGGVFVEPGVARAMADAVLEYRDNRELCRAHGENARQYVAAHFERRQHAAKLEVAFRKVVLPT